MHNVSQCRSRMTEPRPQPQPTSQKSDEIQSHGFRIIRADRQTDHPLRGRSSYTMLPEFFFPAVSLNCVVVARTRCGRGRIFTIYYCQCWADAVLKDAWQGHDWLSMSSVLAAAQRTRRRLDGRWAQDLARLSVVQRRRGAPTTEVDGRPKLPSACRPPFRQPSVRRSATSGHFMATLGETISFVILSVGRSEIPLYPHFLSFSVTLSHAGI